MSPLISMGTKPTLMPIAIVGMSCRFPGDGFDTEAFWQMLLDGRSARSEIPKSRYNIDGFYHPDPDRLGTTTSRTAHFLKDDFTAFDAPFFSITPKEAKNMDPAQRMLLEVAYEGLENAGIRAEGIKGSKTSCFIGSFTNDFKDLLLKANEGYSIYHATGLSPALASNRLSWYFDLRGPSVTIDTACSSSLIALHLGCQSLRSGESEMSIVGGTNLMFGPDMALVLSGGHFLSPDGKCRSFDHGANGYSRGEGVGVTILKTLDAAIRDNDTIRAIIPASASNQDGRTPGLSLPSSEAHEELIRTAYSMAGLDMSHTGYVEAHGTGTAAGDPIEMAAIVKTIGYKRKSKLYIGSVKSNIGHLEGAAGIAGLIKAALIVERGLIPPNLWFEKLNPRISLSEKIEVPTKLTLWPTQGVRRASVNSFGFGGANCHVIIEDAYHYLQSYGLSGRHFTVPYPQSPLSGSSTFGDLKNHLPTANGYYLNGVHSVETNSDAVNSSIVELPKIFVLSSQDQGGIVRTADKLRSYIQKQRGEQEEPHGQSLFNDLSYTLGERRSIMPWKSFAIASTLNELDQKLAEISSAVRSSQIPKLAFVFTGQGAQWFAMGNELIAHSVYRDSLRSSEVVLESLGCSWSLTEELNRAEEKTRLHLAEISQPACAALQIALVDLLRYWQVSPTAVVGHSSGEIAAAYCARILSRECAMKIAWFRGQSANLIRGEPGLKGAMMAVQADAEFVRQNLVRLTQGKAVVACINSPKNCTVSGDSAAIDELRAKLSDNQVSSKKLKIEVAYHSPHMEYVRNNYLKALSDIPTASQSSGDCVPMFSSVTGGLISPASLGASYWVDNLVSPVNFTGAISSLLKHSERKDISHDRTAFANIFVEVGPHSALQGSLREIFSHVENRFGNLSYISILRRGNDGIFTTLQAMGELYCAGYNSALEKINQVGPEVKMLVDLPTYPWNHFHCFWEESHLARDHRLRAKPRLDLLGAPCAGSVEPQWRNFLRVQENPWITHHKVQSSILYPGAGMVVMAIEGIFQVSDPNEDIIGYELRDVTLSNAMRIPDNDRGLEVTLQFRPRKTGTKSDNAVWTEFTVSSYTPDSDKWQIHCTGLIQVTYRSQVTQEMERENSLETQKHRESYLVAGSSCKRHVNSLYKTLDSIGLQFGKTFQNVAELYSGPGQGRGMIRIPDTKSHMPQQFEYPCVIHPAALDSVFHLLFPAIAGPENPLTEAVVPVSIDRLYISANMNTTPGTELYGFSQAESTGAGTWKASIFVGNKNWTSTNIVIQGMNISSLGQRDSRGSEQRQLCSEILWQEDASFLNNDQLKTLILGRTPPGVEDDTLYERLDRICLIYIQHILKWFQTEGKDVAVLGFFKLYYEWMKDRVELVKTPACDLSQLEFALSEAKEALRGSKTGIITMTLIDRIGKNLEKIFTQKVEPLQLMLEGELLYTFYQGGLGASFNGAAAEYVSLLAHKKPNMSILEIGAGTGGTTYHIVNKLSEEDGTMHASSYVFTDISPGFLAAAEDRFSKYASIMQFQTLNIEEDPLKQGFVAASFDVIVAANVLHATKSISQTLSHVRTLLKPDGKLVLAELTIDNLFCGFIMGTLPGWWLGEDDGRKGGPLLTVDRWNNALSQAGFSGVDICVRGNLSTSTEPVSLLISTKLPEFEPATVSAKYIIITNGHPNSAPLSEELQNVFRAQSHNISILPWNQVSLPLIKGKYCVSLLEHESPFLLDISDQDFIKLQQMLLGTSGVLWVTKGATGSCRNPHLSLMTGLSSSIRNENTNISITNIDLEADESVHVDLLASAIYKLALRQVSGDNFDYEYSLRSGTLQIPRIHKNLKLNDHLQRFESKGSPELTSFTESERPLKLSIKTPGLLDSLVFEEDKSYNVPLDPDWVEIQVKATGINFRDILVAMGNIKGEDLGVECSGVISKVGSNITDYRVGDRVFSGALGTFASFTRFPAATAQRIPDDMSFEDAVSMCWIYNTAYYSLVTVGHLDAGESVLIHAAAGGVGQAAISIAKIIGAEIFVTVGSAEKKDLVMKKHAIPEDHIFNSRDLSFAKGIMRVTNGKGVDVVLNSLAGEALRLSWYCLAKFGRFLEIGKADMWSNTGLDMAPFIANKSFHGVNVHEFTNNPSPRSIAMNRKVSELIYSKAIMPVTPVSVFKFSEIEQAFRFLQSGKHMGKLVVKVDPNDKVYAIPFTPRVIVNENATYLLAGGLGGIGRCLGRWLAQKGAKHLVFTSRSAAKTPENLSFVQDLKTEFGVNAVAINCDVGDRESLMILLAECGKSMPPIKGVITGAMVLEDSLFENMAPSTFRVALGPKVHGSWNLHELLPKDMDFFIMLSSLVGMIGHKGQGNYAAGNTFQDALAHHRVSQGLRAMTIDISWLLNIGFLADHEEHVDNVKNLGMQLLRESEIHSLIATAMEGAMYDQSPVPPQVISGLPNGGIQDKWYWIHDGKFALLRNQNSSKQEEKKSAMPLRQNLIQARDLAEAIGLIRQALVDKLARLMMIPTEDVDPTKPLSAYGVDSLVAAEVRNWIAHEIEAEVSVFDVMANIPMSALAVTLASNSTLLKDQGGLDVENL